MGIIRMGPPDELILKLQEKFHVNNFIETGTFEGNTAVWASSHFEKVETIEFSKNIFEATLAHHGKIKNINFIFGDSRVELKKIVSQLGQPAIFWLDSHWCGIGSYGEHDECPLISEIEVMNSSKFENFIFIDDARLFLSPPPLPHQINSWPAISDIISALQSGDHRYYIVIFEDVIIAAPLSAKDEIAGYCQQIVTRQWNEGCGSPNRSDLRAGIDSIASGFGIIFKRVSHRITGWFKK